MVPGSYYRGIRPRARAGQDRRPRRRRGRLPDQALRRGRADGPPARLPPPGSHRRPDGEDLEIIDINFNADTLPVGRTTPSFYISISLKAKQGGTPAAYVVRANEPRFKETGTATLTAQGGTATLRVKGTNDMGETMDMTAVCKPQKK